MKTHDHAAQLQALRRIAEGNVMKGTATHPFTHAETVHEYQRIARRALEAWDRHNAKKENETC